MVIVTNQKEARRVTKLPDSITELPSNWIDCQLPVCDSLWNNARESNQNPNASVPYHRLLTASLHHMKAPRLLIRVGHSSWGMSLLCSPLHQLRIKATFLFPPSSVSIFFYSALVDRESQDFGQQHLYVIFKWPSTHSPKYHCEKQCRSVTFSPAFIL